MNPAIVILDKFLDEALILIQYLLPHVGYVVQYGLILHKEVLLCTTPSVVVREGLDGREGGEGYLVVLGLPCLVHKANRHFPRQFNVCE